MTVCFRPAKQGDLDDIHQLALNAGFGMTSLCKDKDELAEKINVSEASFGKNLKRPLCENYLFVLEDVDNNRVVGTSAIESAIGYHHPWYAYRLSKVTKVCRDLDLHLSHDVLVLTNDMHGFSEIGTLYLDPNYRKNANGLLLSRARFMFIAGFMHRFSEFIIAEMRGVSDKKGMSPFWESLGRHFFRMPFVKADELSGASDKQFIADLLPHAPIYTSMLSTEAQKVIGVPHESTKPAMKILEREGFRKCGYVDIFDAGPAIKAEVKSIKTVKQSTMVTVSEISESVKGDTHLLSNERLDFRAIKANALINDEACILDNGTASLLQVSVGDSIRAIPFFV